MNLLTAHSDFIWLTVVIQTPKQFVARPPVVFNPYEIKQSQNNQSIFDRIISKDYKIVFARHLFYFEWKHKINLGQL